VFGIKPKLGCILTQLATKPFDSIENLLVVNSTRIDSGNTQVS
jgi:hypothetical protein